MTTILESALDTHPAIVGVRSRVVTLTPSPAIDRVYRISSLVPGSVNRAAGVETYLAGKGINVAKTLRTAGNRTIAVAPMSRADTIAIADDPALYRTVNITTPTRVNTVILGGDGSTTNINQPATALEPVIWLQLCAAAGTELQAMDADWLVVAGSMPREAGTGATLDAAPLVAEARRAGARICLDSGGATLRRWIATGHAPDLVKPNVHELAATVGRPLRTVGDVVEASRELVSAGVATVLASLGSDGAVVVTQSQAFWARAPRVDVVNTTGAGDAALAGFLCRWAGDPQQLRAALVRAVSWGSLAVGEATPVIGAVRPVSGVEAGRPDYDRPLTDGA